MTAYYYQGSPILAPLSITSNQPMFSDDTVSLKQIRTAQNSQRWELRFDVLTNDNAVDLLLSSVENIDSAQTMIMPQLKQVADATTLLDDSDGTELFISAHASEPAGETSISLTRAAGRGIAPRGSFVRFSNHNKVYLLKTQIDFDSFTTGSVDIYPSLRVPLSIGTEMFVGNACLLSYYTSIDNQKGITYNDGVLSSPGNITLIEAI